MKKFKDWLLNSWDGGYTLGCISGIIATVGAVIILILATITQV